MSEPNQSTQDPSSQVHTGFHLPTDHPQSSYNDQSEPAGDRRSFVGFGGHPGFFGVSGAYISSMGSTRIVTKSSELTRRPPTLPSRLGLRRRAVRVRLPLIRFPASLSVMAVLSRKQRAKSE